MSICVCTIFLKKRKKEDSSVYKRHPSTGVEEHQNMQRHYKVGYTL
jgi:hypothetical protein